MRILIKNKKIFFNKFFRYTNISKRQLASKLSVNFWTLKNWIRYENYTIPKNIFLHILEICPRLKNIDYTELPDNWGLVKGGKNSFEKKTQKEVNKLVEAMHKASMSKINLPKKLDEDFYELYGILMGDGCISKFYSENRWKHAVIITGHSKEDYLYFKNRVTKLFHKNFNIEPSIRFVKSCNAIRIDVRHRTIAEFLLKLGFPLGVKGEIHIPRRMSFKNLKYINMIIRGLFDTDGCFASRKDEGYKYPYMIITTYSKKLQNQLKEILKGQGFPAYIHANSVVIRGIRNANRWFEVIGSSHPRTLERFQEWKSSGKLLPKYKWAGRSTEEV